jgi:hypothetical protein
VSSPTPPILLHYRNRYRYQNLSQPPAAISFLLLRRTQENLSRISDAYRAVWSERENCRTTVILRYRRRLPWVLLASAPTLKAVLLFALSSSTSGALSIVPRQTPSRSLFYIPIPATPTLLFCFFLLLFLSPSCFIYFSLSLARVPVLGDFVTQQ